MELLHIFIQNKSKTRPVKYSRPFHVCSVIAILLFEKLVKMETGLLDSNTKAAIKRVFLKFFTEQLSCPSVFRHGEKA